MNEFTHNNYTFRIKKMNVIELMALRSSISFSDIESLQKTYNSMLERVEVKITDDKWLQCKSGHDYYPNGLEHDFEMVEAIITHFLLYIKEVFTKSNSSSKEQV